MTKDERDVVEINEALVAIRREFNDMIKALREGVGKRFEVLADGIRELCGLLRVMVDELESAADTQVVGRR